jgi:hypothetical protein
MTKYFFDVEEDNRELFNNLNISKNQEAMKHCGKYPIIYNFTDKIGFVYIVKIVLDD